MRADGASGGRVTSRVSVAVLVAESIVSQSGELGAVAWVTGGGAGVEAYGDGGGSAEGRGVRPAQAIAAKKAAAVPDIRKGRSI
jgi:hypothetical protein